jgi:hypothetical protein
VEQTDSPDAASPLPPSKKRKDVKAVDFSCWEGVKCAPLELFEGHLLKGWSYVVARFSWNIVRKAPNRQGVLERLTLLACVFPSQKEYVMGNLFSTIHLWADCYRAWEFTGEVEFSEVAEHWFKSFKGILKGNTVGLLEYPDFIVEASEKRNAVTYDIRRLKIVTGKLPVVAGRLAADGWRPILDTVFAYMGENQVSLMIAFSAVSDSSQYDLITEANVCTKDILTSCGYDTPSPSQANLLSLFSGRVLLSEELLLDPRFAGHVQPSEGASRAVLFVVGRHDRKVSQIKYWDRLFFHS